MFLFSFILFLLSLNEACFPLICKVKLLILLMESGGFEASDITAVYPKGRGVSEAPVLRHPYTRTLSSGSECRI